MTNEQLLRYPCCIFVEGKTICDHSKEEDGRMKRRFEVEAEMILLTEDEASFDLAVQNVIVNRERNLEQVWMITNPTNPKITHKIHNFEMRDGKLFLIPWVFGAL